MLVFIKSLNNGNAITAAIAPMPSLWKVCGISEGICRMRTGSCSRNLSHAYWKTMDISSSLEAGLVVASSEPNTPQSAGELEFLADVANQRNDSVSPVNRNSDVEEDEIL